MIFRYANMFNKNSGFLVNMFLGFLEEVWDLVSNFMIPSVIIEEKSIKEIVPDLKKLKNNVPATLTGVFGIDFAGSAVKSLNLGSICIGNNYFSSPGMAFNFRDNLRDYYLLRQRSVQY